jgi:hypothetical protein
VPAAAVGGAVSGFDQNPQDPAPSPTARGAAEAEAELIVGAGGAATATHHAQWSQEHRYAATSAQGLRCQLHQATVPAKARQRAQPRWADIQYCVEGSRGRPDAVLGPLQLQPEAGTAERPRDRQGQGTHPKAPDNPGADLASVAQARAAAMPETAGPALSGLPWRMRVRCRCSLQSRGATLAMTSSPNSSATARRTAGGDGNSGSHPMHGLI